METDLCRVLGLASAVQPDVVALHRLMITEKMRG